MDKLIKKQKTSRKDAKPQSLAKPVKEFVFANLCAFARGRVFFPAFMGLTRPSQRLPAES
ncbi:MAG: hypothetical protein ACRD18_12220 [Terriglobia bacterium]